MPDAPPDHVVEVARLAAIKSPCAKSKRGAVLFDPQDGIILSDGFNGQPAPFECMNTDYCRKVCGKLCLHAEQRALMHVHSDYLCERTPDLQLVHVRVVDGELVPGGGPSCWQCSRIVVEMGIAGVWLYEHDNRVPGAPGKWRFYRAREFHRETAADLARKETA